jgi:hypothetical protein
MSRKRHNRRTKIAPTKGPQPLADQAAPTEAALPALAVPAVQAGQAVPAAQAAPSASPRPAAADPLTDGAASDEAAVAFFSAPPVTHSVEPLLPEPPPERVPVRRVGDSKRRRDLARYVTGAVAVCFLICVAAAVRAGTVRADTSTPAAAVAARAPVPVEPAAAPPPVVPEPGVPEAVPPSAVEPVQAAEPVREAVPDPAPKPADDKAVPSVDARSAKRRAQRAIDRGDAAGAIEAARQSLDLDESDAETWLILGAAYLQRGAYRDAQASFADCVHKATHGDKGECRALLR